MWGPVAGAKYGRVIDALYNSANRQEIGALRSHFGCINCKALDPASGQLLCMIDCALSLPSVATPYASKR